MTVAFSPWMSDTTAMIDVTATMLPSTLMNERSLLLQMARSAMSDAFEDAAHNPYFLAAACSFTASPSFMLADRVERADDDLVAILEARQDLEVLLSRDAGLDRDEHGLAAR